MLKITNVNKYFNKGKKNELHVINNTTLSFENNGLVALLGSSGCGKTTLLNAIGGLDKIKSGSIYINGEKISSKFSGKVDKIRNLNVGYIFQDYKLIDNLTVFDNVAIVLKMIGIKDKTEIKKRVEYVLSKVNMLRYKNRPAAMLSGGERQRVGIARAIVKDPNIILADEPTGNLDSKNTIEIMNIIRAISKDRLVILVTHEVDLAKFYATRIIEIKDGTVVKDYENSHSDSLDYEMDNRFFLKDFEDNINLTDKDYDINIYKNKNDKINIELVVKNGNIYIKSSEKVEVVDNNSNIEFINDHYKSIEKSDIENYEFNFKDVINNNIRKKYSSILNPISLIANGFRKVFAFPVLKKILLVGFFLSGLFIMYSFSTALGALNIEDKDFLTINRNYLTVKKSSVTIEEYLKYENNDFIDYILPGNSIVNLNLDTYDYYQFYKYMPIEFSLASLDMIDNHNIILGNFPQKDNEVVIDKFVINKLLKNDEIKMLGYKSIDNFLGRSLTTKDNITYIITGICESNSPSLYTKNNNFISMIIGEVNSNDYYDDPMVPVQDVKSYNLYKDNITIKEGRMPNNDYEVIVNISNKEFMPINKKISTKVNNKELTVVGYYDSAYNYEYLFVNDNTIKYKTITENNDMVVYTKDKDKAIEYFRNLKLNIKDSYEQSKLEYTNSLKDSVSSSLLVSSVILLISLIEIYLMIRSSFLSRIKEIGILRAIGIKKIDIYKMFFGEIFAITTIASAPGILFMAYILNVISNISYISNMFLINIPIVLSTIIFIYLFNLLVGLLPVSLTLRKRPAEILSRHDLD